MGYKATSLDEYSLTRLQIVLPPSTWSKNPRGWLLNETEVYYIFMDDGDCFSTENAMEVPGENVYFCKCT